MNKIRKLFLSFWLSGLFSCLVLSCASVQFIEDISAYESKIKALAAKIQADSANAEALSDLGVIYFQTRNYATAEEYLKKAFVEKPLDPKTAFYLGMTLEFQDKIQLALRFYERYKDAPRLSPYRRLMSGRYQQLTYNLTRQEVRELLQQEQQLSETRMSPQAVAVFPLRYLGQDKRFAALGKGLSEMIITDLGRVDEIKLLERIRLQSLLEEIALAQSDLVDQSTAPRFGKLLGAGRIVAGTFTVTEKDQLQTDVLSWDIINRNFPAAATGTEALQNLFRLEKTIVFNVIADMGIELTPEAREKIQFIPTQNLQAFLAYCQGLEQEDAGQFARAASFYQQAAQLDPNFDLAGSKAEITQSLSEAGGSRESATAVAQTIDPPIATDAPTSQPDLVADRLQNLGVNVGSNFVPGEDTRKPTEEANKAYGDLPKPPAPPPRL
jgi:tetratricopeptide (TPR) repeat protein